MSWLARLKNQKATGTHPAEPTEPGFAGFAGNPDRHIQKIEGEPPAANDPAPDPERWSYPHSLAMTGAEIDTFTARLLRFTDRGVALLDSEAAADRLIRRDREQDDRCMCLECLHLAGRDPAWSCRNWKQASVSIKAGDARLPVALVLGLQRCDGFLEVKL